MLRHAPPTTATVTTTCTLGAPARLSVASTCARSSIVSDTVARAGEATVAPGGRRFGTARPGRGRRRDEQGVATLMVVLLALALFAAAGLVIDGGYALAAKRQAMDQAEQAARVGADALDTGSLRDGQTAVDPDAATAAVRGYLAAAGADGTVTIGTDGRVSVTVSTSQKTTMLSAIGVDTLPVEATATAVSIGQNDG